MQGAGSGGPHGEDEQHSRRPFWRQPFGTGRFGRISSPSAPLCTSSTRQCPPSRTASQIASVAHAQNIEIGSKLARLLRSLNAAPPKGPSMTALPRAVALAALLLSAPAFAA